MSSLCFAPDDEILSAGSNSAGEQTEAVTTDISKPGDAPDNTSTAVSDNPIYKFKPLGYLDDDQNLLLMYIDNDFKVFNQLYDEECKNEMKLIFELNKGMNKNQMAYITLMSDDIIYAECYAHELIIHTYEHEYAVKMTLKKFMEQVKQAHCFIQIHRSYAINMKYIYRIDKNHINMVNEESKNELEIGRKYKKEVNEAFRNYLMDKF